MTTVSVYRLFASPGDLLYVGTTSNVGRRLKDHRRKSWWSRVTRIRVTEFPSRYDAEHEEWVAIRREQPSENVACNTITAAALVERTPYSIAELMRLLPPPDRLRNTRGDAMPEWTARSLLGCDLPAVREFAERRVNSSFWT